MVACVLWRSEALRVVPWLHSCTTMHVSDLHYAQATILNLFINELKLAFINVIVSQDAIFMNPWAWRY